jgi:hypothetical protein
VLHIAEPGADFHAPAGCEGLTLCGLVLVRDELWVPIIPRDADRICRPCADGRGPLVARQLVLVESV